MKVEGIEIWAVRWPDKFSSSADDSSSEFLFQERLCHIGAVRRSSVLHPPGISSCCVRSKKWPNSILQEFEVAITIHGNFAPSLINERMDQWNLSFHDWPQKSWLFGHSCRLSQWTHEDFLVTTCHHFFDVVFWCKTNSLLESLYRMLATVFFVLWPGDDQAGGYECC